MENMKKLLDPKTGLAPGGDACATVTMVSGLNAAVGSQAPARFKDKASLLGRSGVNAPRRFCLMAGLLALLTISASGQSWFFDWDGTTDITCVPTSEGNNAFFQGGAASSSFYWEVVDNGSGGKAFREVVTGNTGFRWYGYGSRPEYYRGPCDTFAMENFRADHNGFTITFRIKAENCTSTSNVRFFNCEFETTVPDPLWPSSYDPFYTFRVEFSLRKDNSSSDIWLTDFRIPQDLAKLKIGSTADWHTIWATCELPPYPYTTSNCVYRLWIDGTEVAWNDRDKGGWSDCEVGWTPTSSANATFSLDYLCYTYGTYLPGAIAIPAERAVASTNTISGIKSYADGTPVVLTNKIVTGIFTDPRLNMKYYYVSETNGSDGIKVRHQTGKSPQAGGSNVNLALGDIVSLKGGLSSAECEKQISAYEITRTSTGASLSAPATVTTADLVKSYNSALFTSTAAQLLGVPVTGVVSSVTGTNKITDTGKSWTVNQWKNATVFLPGTATRTNLYYYIISNSVNTLTVSHRTIRPDFNVGPDIVADGVRAGDSYEFVGGKPAGPPLDGHRVRTTGTVAAVNVTSGYFDLNDGNALGEVLTLQDIWDQINYGGAWTPPSGLRVKWSGAMPSFGARLSVKGCAGAERFRYQVSTTINGSPRDEVKVDKVYPMVAADSYVPLVEPLFTAVGLTATGFAAQISLTPGEPYRVRASSDLQSWVDLTNFVATTPNYLFVDPAATGQPRRFYRAVSP